MTGLKCQYCSKDLDGTRRKWCSDDCFQYARKKKFSGLKPTPRQELMVKLWKGGMSKKDAYLTAYGKDKDLPAASQKSVNMFKTKGVQIALREYKDLAEQTLVDVMSDWGRSVKPRERELALDAAKYVHDKLEGKATQRVETKSEVISFSINLQAQQEEE